MKINFISNNKSFLKKALSYRLENLPSIPATISILKFVKMTRKSIYKHPLWMWYFLWAFLTPP